MTNVVIVLTETERQAVAEGLQRLKDAGGFQDGVHTMTVEQLDDLIEEVLNA